MPAAALLHRRPRGVALIPCARYGAFELQRDSRRHLACGVTLSASFTTLVFLAVAVLVARNPPAVREPVRVILHHWVYTPPPSPLQDPQPGGPATPAVAVDAGSGIVIPVPELPDHTAAELPGLDPAAIALPIEGGLAPAGAAPAPRQSGAGSVPEGAAANSAPGSWTSHDTEPEIVVAYRASYPELARTAMVEGRVKLWLLVGKDGRVVRVDVKEGVTLLTPAAVEAARGYLFKPAQSNGHPVAVWVEETFDFRIVP